jgi:hypothetical protein
MDEKTRLEARELYMRAKVYRILALVFAAVGLLIFISLYINNVGGGIFEALHRPSTVLIVLLPFLPSYIFSRLSVKAEKKFTAMMAAHKAKSAADASK